MAEILVLGFQASGRKGPRHIRPVVAGAVVDNGVGAGEIIAASAAADAAAAAERNEVGEMVLAVEEDWDGLLDPVEEEGAGTSLEMLGW